MDMIEKTTTVNQQTRNKQTTTPMGRTRRTIPMTSNLDDALKRMSVIRDGFVVRNLDGSAKTDDRERRKSRVASSTGQRWTLQWRCKEIESLVIDDHRGANQGLRTDAGVPDGEAGVSLAEITDGLERGIMRGAMPNDAGSDDLRATQRRADDVNQADGLIGMPGADLRPRQRFGLVGCEARGSIHASIFSGSCRVSSFLRRNTSIDDDLGLSLPPVATWRYDADVAVAARDDRGKTLQSVSKKRRG